jgi:hypothetical protein
MDWTRAALRHEEERVERRLFDGTRRLLAVSNFSDTPRAVALARLPGAWG